MTRLKYYDMYDLLWTDWFTVGPNLVIRGVIDKTNNYYKIHQFDSTIVCKGTADNLRQAKSIIKKKLQDSGVVFDGEIRRRD